MKALFSICDGWENCENEKIRDLREKVKIKRGNFVWPWGLVLEELDKICAECNHALEIKESECPVCGGTVLGIPEFPIPSEIKATSGSQYFYECMNCKRHLYSFHKID